MEALSSTTYEKCYFPNYEIGKPLKNPRKVKVVKVKDVSIIFKDFIRNNGYAIIPQ